MAVAIRKDALYTIIPRNFGRTYPIEVVISEHATSECLLFVKAHQVVTIKIQKLLDGDLILAMVTKYSPEGKITDAFQAQLKRADFGRMIDPDYPIY
jgi:hypothetical protein